MKNALFLGLNKAYNSLREWTDPAYEGIPYETPYVKNEPSGLKKLFMFRKKMLWRS